MNNENKFTKIVAAAVIIVAIVIGVSYGIYYNGFDDLGKNMDGSESVPQFSPIKPFEAYSTLKQNIIELFGEGKQGEGVSDDTKYIDYKQEWFSIMADTRYYYGKEKRVYKTVLTYKLNDKDKLYLEMKKWLGEPLEDSLSDKEAKKPRVFWIKDSVSYELLVEKNKIVVESNLFSIVKGSIVKKLPTKNPPIKLPVSAKGTIEYSFGKLYCSKGFKIGSFIFVIAIVIKEKSTNTEPTVNTKNSESFGIVKNSCPKAVER